MDAFKEIVEQKIEPKLLNIFHNKPSSKLEIVEVTLQLLYIILDCFIDLDPKIRRFLCFSTSPGSRKVVPNV